MQLKKKFQIIGIGLAILILPVLLGMYSLGYFKFFAPMQENIRREVFENTKSYVHGVEQDLGKYYDEYRKAETDADREAVRQIVLVRFAEFDENKIQSQGLRNFLCQMRGY